MIKSELKKVRSLLDESVRYVIPTNQRNYEWKKEQGEEFWDDISQNSIYLGTLVFNVSKESENEISIVDGQQRITTIFVLLAACRHQAKKINSTDQAAAIQNKISFIDDTSGKASSSKLIPSPSIRETFLETITNDKWDGKKFELKNKKRQIGRIKPLYEFFVDRVSKLDKDTLADLLKKLYESTFVRIDIGEVQEAFDIFERTNARGLELNAADLLKNYLFSRSTSEKVEEEWDEIVDNSYGNLLRMVKYFYVSKLGPVQKKNLFKLLKKYGEETGVDSLLKQIKEFSFFYSLIVGGSYNSILEWATDTDNNFFRKEYSARSLNRAFDAIKLFGVTQAYPVIVKLMTTISSIEDSKLKEKASEKFLDFVVAIEKFHFLNYAVSQRPGNQIENYYADKCKIALNKKNITEFISQTIKELQKEKVVGKAEFQEKFATLSYQSDFHLIYYIFDRMNNFGRKGGQHIEIYNPDRKLIKRNYDIDHLVAQDLEEYEFDNDEMGEMIDSIGNLLVISKHTNGGLQNKNITSKLEVLREKEIQNLLEAAHLLIFWENRKWAKVQDVLKNIEERIGDLSDRAYSSVWKI
jgi:uncharacterized protein with ParB-like and HNH nuclease domain